MTQNETIGNRLSALRVRSGLSLQATATAAGYRNGSSIQRYFEPNYNPDYLPAGIARRLITALSGRGDPPILDDEILELMGLDSAYMAIAKEPVIVSQEKYSVIETEWDFDRALGPDWASIRAPVIAGQRMHKLNRPYHLAGSGGVAYVISNELMVPRYLPGELIVTTTRIPPKTGDHVVVIGPGIDSDAGDFGGVIYARMGRLLYRSDSEYELEQYNPAERFTIPRGEVTAIHPILDSNAILGWKS